MGEWQGRKGQAKAVVIGSSDAARGLKRRNVVLLPVRLNEDLQVDRKIRKASSALLTCW